MTYKSTDILILGSSPYSIGVAIGLGKLGKEVLIVETEYEHVTRGFYKIEQTLLNDTPIEGHTFHDSCLEHLKKHGVEFSLAFQSFDKISFDSQEAKFKLEGFDFELKANKIIYSPNITSHRGKLPLTFDKLGVLWSGCSWSDAHFYRHQKTGVYGNGSFAANQALMASEFKNTVTIYNPDTEFIADDYLLSELKLLEINIINNCKKFTLITGEENLLESVEFEMEGRKIINPCTMIYEGRVTGFLEAYFGKYPKVEEFSFHERISLLFEYDKEYKLGMEKGSVA